MRWTQGPTRACSPRHARSAGAGRERRSFQTGYHTTPRYPIRPRLDTIRNSANCRFPGFFLMARPGLEPGTPRFSVVRSWRLRDAKSLENKRFSRDMRSMANVAICGLFPAIQEMTGGPSPFWRVRSRIHSTTSSWLVSPPATRSTMPASVSTSGGPHCRPLASRNRAVSRNAARLLASGSGWFFARC
jgi:hypothetical protein